MSFSNSKYNFYVMIVFIFLVRRNVFRLPVDSCSRTSSTISIHGNPKFVQYHFAEVCCQYQISKIVLVRFFFFNANSENIENLIQRVLLYEETHEILHLVFSNSRIYFRIPPEDAKRSANCFGQRSQREELFICEWKQRHHQKYRRECLLYENFVYIIMFYNVTRLTYRIPLYPMFTPSIRAPLT